MLKIFKKKNNRSSRNIIVTSVEGYCGVNYEEKLKEFKKKHKVIGVVPIKSIVLYEDEKVSD